MGKGEEKIKYGTIKKLLEMLANFLRKGKEEIWDVITEFKKLIPYYVGVAIGVGIGLLFADSVTKLTNEIIKNVFESKEQLSSSGISMLIGFLALPFAMSFLFLHLINHILNISKKTSALVSKEPYGEKSLQLLYILACIAAAIFLSISIDTFIHFILLYPIEETSFLPNVLNYLGIFMRIIVWLTMMLSCFRKLDFKNI